MFRVIRLVLLALWFGGGVFLALVGTPAAFAGAPDRATAGAIAGIMLSRWSYVSLIAPALLLGLEWRDGLLRGARTAFLALAIVAAVAQLGIDMKLRAIRDATPGGVSLLAADDPTRRLFGALHGASVASMGLQLILAGATLVSVARQREGG